MPIGTIIGWLIGLTFSCWIINAKNSRSRSDQPLEVQLARQNAVNVTAVVGLASLLGLIGTIIELVVR